MTLSCGLPGCILLSCCCWANTDYAPFPPVVNALEEHPPSTSSFAALGNATAREGRTLNTTNYHYIGMATASPTPMGGATHFSQLQHRPASRQAYRPAPSRPNLQRHVAASNIPKSHGSRSSTQASQFSLNDSSDDEIPQPMKFSALTNALINEEVSLLAAESVARSRRSLSGSTAVDEAEKRTRLGSALRERGWKEGSQSPATKRTVYLSSTPGSATVRRTMSTSVRRPHEDERPQDGSPRNLSTPAHMPRTVRIPMGSHGHSGGSVRRDSPQPGSGTRTHLDVGDDSEDPATVARAQAAISQGSVTRYAATAMGRSRYGEETGMQSSLRLNRAGMVTGKFLSGRPRRIKRRQSEEDQSPMHEQMEESGPGSSQDQGRSQESGYQGPASSQTSLSQRALTHDEDDEPASGDLRNYEEPVRAQVTHSPPPQVQSSHGFPSRGSSVRPSSVQKAQPLFKVPAQRPDLPSSHDQENEPPPTFKRNKPAASIYHDSIEKVSIQPQEAPLSVMRAMASPERKVLATRSQNTPRRAAPPPPKMSVLHTATVAAGAATTSHSSKKRNLMKVNGKQFTRLNLLGKGGSSRVYRVMAENYKDFALKRVNLEEADEMSIRGFKGEIDLLKKLEGVDRVVRLYDWELNEEKQTLIVVSPTH